MGIFTTGRVVIVLASTLTVASLFTGFLLTSNSSTSLPDESLKLGPSSDLSFAENRTFEHQILDLRWEEFKANYESMLEQAQYCTLWCRKSDQIFKNKGKTYRNPADAWRNWYDNKWQHTGEEALGLRCCQVVTRTGLDIVYDSRPAGFEQEDQITLVTMGTADRLPALKLMRKNWEGPMVVVFYSNDYTSSDWETEFNKTMAVIEGDQWRDTAIIHYVSRWRYDERALRLGVNMEKNYRTVTLPKGQTVEEEVMLPDFPINALRNIAMDYARTRFVFADDIDLFPSEDVYSFASAQLPLLASKDKVAIAVVPFTKRLCADDYLEMKYPMNFVQIQANMKQGLVNPYHCDLPYWKQNHNKIFKFSNQNLHGSCSFSKADRRFQACPTVENLSRFAEWYNGSSTSSRELISVPRHITVSITGLQHWEPYVIQSRVTVDGPIPRYNEMFVSRGYDKVSFIASLRVLGYQFYVAPSGFLFHHEHADAPWKNRNTFNRLENRVQKQFELYVNGLAPWIDFSFE